MDSYNRTPYKEPVITPEKPFVKTFFGSKFDSVFSRIFKRKNLIPILIALIVLGGAGVFIVQNNKTQKAKRDPWLAFEKYKAAAAAQDLAGMNLASRNQYIEICKSKEECDTVFGYLNQYLSQIKKEDYVNVWEDEKQIILSTNKEIQESDAEKLFGIKYLLFVKDENGMPKFLTGLSDGQIREKADKTLDELDAELQLAITDTDKDGLFDARERCEVALRAGETCVKSDPNNRDTDSDGWWDGVEIRFE